MKLNKHFAILCLSGFHISLNYLYTTSVRIRLLNLVLPLIGIVMIVLVPIASLTALADREETIHENQSLALGCDITIFIATLTLKMEGHTYKINCEKKGGYYDLKEDGSIVLDCYHENPFVWAKHLRMDKGETVTVKCVK